MGLQWVEIFMRIWKFGFSARAESDHHGNYSLNIPYLSLFVIIFQLKLVMSSLYCCACVLYSDALFSSLTIVWLHTERQCTALVEGNASVLGYQHCTIGFSIGWCNNAASTFWWWEYKHTKLVLIAHDFVFLSESSVKHLPGCIYIPERQKVAECVLWMQNKRSGMSSSFFALLSVSPVLSWLLPAAAVTVWQYHHSICLGLNLC